MSARSRSPTQSGERRSSHGAAITEAAATEAGGTEAAATEAAATEAVKVNGSGDRAARLWRRSVPLIFDIFAAAWCTQAEGRSKVCPQCQRCLCDHPAYREQHFWKEAPVVFQREGFQRLFLFYL